MKIFPEHSFVVDIPKERAQAVITKITGEFGKFERDDFRVKPFTGTVKEGAFRIAPNIANTSVRLRGKIESEGIEKTRITVNGKMHLGRIMIMLLIAIPAASLIGTLISLSFMDQEANGVIMTIGLVILVAALISIIGSAKYPGDQYDRAVQELMRKLDIHDLVL